MQLLHHKRLIMVFVVILCIFLPGFLVVFDLTTPAYKFDEEYNGLCQVALGPRSRYFFCKPSYDIHYDGREWLFLVFKPMCSLSRCLAGYAPPKQSP